MSSQGGEGDHCRALPIKCQGVPTMTYQEKNRLKSDSKKPADKLRKSNFTRAENQSLAVNIDVCNNVVSECTTKSDRHRRRKPSYKATFLVNHEAKLNSRSCSFRTEQSATRSTRGMQSGKPQPPGRPLISSKMQKIKKTKRPVQLSGTKLIWQWVSGGATLSITHLSSSDYHKDLKEM